MGLISWNQPLYTPHAHPPNCSPPSLPHTERRKGGRERVIVAKLPHMLLLQRLQRGNSNRGYLLLEEDTGETAADIAAKFVIISSSSSSSVLFKKNAVSMSGENAHSGLFFFGYKFVKVFFCSAILLLLLPLSILICLICRQISPLFFSPSSFLTYFSSSFHITQSLDRQSDRSFLIIMLPPPKSFRDLFREMKAREGGKDGNGNSASLSTLLLLPISSFSSSLILLLLRKVLFFFFFRSSRHGKLMCLFLKKINYFNAVIGIVKNYHCLNFFNRFWNNL